MQTGWSAPSTRLRRRASAARSSSRCRTPTRSRPPSPTPSAPTSTCSSASSSRRARSRRSPTRTGRPGGARRQLDRRRPRHAGAVMSDGARSMSPIRSCSPPARRRARPAGLLPAGAGRRRRRHAASARSNRSRRWPSYLERLLADLPTVDARPGADAARPGRAGRARVGRSARSRVAYDDANDRIVLVAEELSSPTRTTSRGRSEHAAPARIRADARQVRRVLSPGPRELVAAGRPPCRLCGRPIDPDGHACPRMNWRIRTASLADERRGRGRGPHAVELERHLPRRRCCDGDDWPRRSTSRTRGERPLWDFPAGPLPARGGGVRSCREALGWGIVPADRPARRGAPRRGLAAAVRRRPTSSSTTSRCTRSEPSAHDQLRTICAFDLLANNTDRKSGHCLLGLTTARIWAIDNGLCFHAEFKLRTVIWEFGGEHIPDRLLDDVAGSSMRGIPDDLADAARPVERDALLGAWRALGARAAASPSTHAAAATPGRLSDSRRSRARRARCATSTGSAPRPRLGRSRCAREPRAGAATRRGRQLWPAAAYAEYRLALEAPGEFAALVIDEGAGQVRARPTDRGGGVHPHVGRAGAASRRRPARGDHRARAGRSAARTSPATVESTHPC